MEQLIKSEGALMEPRIRHSKVAPQGFQAALQLYEYVKHCGLEISLLNLINVHASQINGCAYCIDAHAREARDAGESEQRLYALSAWREAPFYSDRERAALAWTEAVTLIAIDHASDEVYDQARQYFNEKELVDLTFAIVSINTFNRLSTSFRNPVAGRFPHAPDPSQAAHPSQ